MLLGGVVAVTHVSDVHFHHPLAPTFAQRLHRVGGLVEFALWLHLRLDEHANALVVEGERLRIFVQVERCSENATRDKVDELSMRRLGKLVKVEWVTSVPTDRQIVNSLDVCLDASVLIARHAAQITFAGKPRAPTNAKGGDLPRQRSRVAAAACCSISITARAIKCRAPKFGVVTGSVVSNK